MSVSCAARAFMCKFIYLIKLYELLCFEMVEQTGSTNKDKQSPMLLGAVGLILAIFGLLEFLVPGMPFRRSGIGTFCLVVGIILLAVAYLRLNSTSTK